MGNLELDFHLLWQSEDTLLTQVEADKVEQVIDSIWETQIVENILHILSGKRIPDDLDTKEVFYITRRASIIDAINSRSQEVAEILWNTFPDLKWKVPMSVVMALAINDILITLANHGELKNIHVKEKEQSYVTQVGINKKRKYGTSTFTKQSPAEALRKILKRRNQLSYEQSNSKAAEKHLKEKETAKQGLIENWILIPIDGSSGPYKIKHIRYSQSLRKSSHRFEFHFSLDGKNHNCQRSTTEHTVSWAFTQVVCELSKILKLSQLEKSILLEKQYTWISLYE